MNNKSKLFYVSAAMLFFSIVVNVLAYIVSAPKMHDDIEINYAKNTMKQSDAESVMAVIHAEGFDSAFLHYSTYKDIHDIRFHQLRKEYLAARNELMDYIVEAGHIKNEYPYYMAQDK